MNYLGIDVGGTKTLAAIFDSKGNVVTKTKIKTDKNYQNFISNIEKSVAKISTNTNSACALAIPGLISRDTGVVHALGNLDWEDKPIRDDIAKVIGDIPVIIENDSRLAGLAEADELIDQYKLVLYLNIGTGIGGALLKNGFIVQELQDTEMGKIPLIFNGAVRHWEEFAAGRSIKERYGKLASEIDSAEQWKEVGERIACGAAVCVSVLQPDVIVFGGGVGQFVDHFSQYLKTYLENHLHPVVKQPRALLKAKFSEDSVIRGCYLLLKQQTKIKPGE